MNELLTTFDAWVAAGRVPDYGRQFIEIANLKKIQKPIISSKNTILFIVGPISSSFDGFFVILYVTYFGLSILLIAGAHSVIQHHKS